MAEKSCPQPRVIAWELTRRCPLSCKHCRAAAGDDREGELSTEECRRVLESIAAFASPILILTGGEPMVRDDVYEIAGRATELGLRVVMAPSGVLLNEKTVRKILDSGVRMISISLDGADAESHDSFRGQEGAFEAALRGIEVAKQAGLKFQINTTVTRDNAGELPRLLDLARELGAVTFNPFMLVPTGRGKALADRELPPERYEEVLWWLADQRESRDIPIRVTCGPHFQRILRQGDYTVDGRPQGGCLGGKSFAFISYRGKVQICGFLEVECGDLRDNGYDFGEIWRESPMLRRIRDVDSYGGRCGYCEYRRVCGGCRARAYAATGDYMAEEPRCSYQPRRQPGSGRVELTGADRKMLSMAQSGMPLTRRPYHELADALDRDPDELIARIRALHDAGFIRRVGAVFDSKRLGYVTTLVAACVPESRLENVAETVSALPTVSHNYRRTHDYNLWFTLRGRSEEELEEELDHLRKRTGVEQMHSLPALAVYNRDVVFDLDGRDEKESSRVRPRDDSGSTGEVELTDHQRRLAAVLQGHLPITAEPYAAAAESCGWTVEEALRQIRKWSENGLIRRVAVLLNHRRAGVRANGMAVFRVPEHRVDEVGRKLAGYSRVTHCYRRATAPGWDYNLFAMAHGESREEVESFVAGVADEAGLKDYEILYSTREFKKESPRYFDDEKTSAIREEGR